MPLRALLTKLASDHEAAGETALAFTDEADARRQFRVTELAYELIAALDAAEADDAPVRAVRRVPIEVRT